MQVSSRPPDTDRSWREVASGELLQLMSRWRKEDVDSVARTAKDAGNAMKGVWDNLKDVVGKALGFPALRDRISPDTREDIASLASATAYGVGYAAAGVMGLAGVAKIASGRKKKDRQRVLDGLVDLAAAATIGVSVAGLGPVRAVVGPVAAALGVARGGYNATVGYRTTDARGEIQGVLDGTRAFGTLCQLLAGLSGVLGVVGVVLAPVAGALQVGRGYHDLNTGLKEGSNRKEINGLADIGVAVGTTMALTGIGTIPGIALTVASTAARVAYQFHGGSRKRLDRVIDRIEPGLQKAVNGLNRAAAPLVKRVDPLRRKIVDRWAR